MLLVYLPYVPSRFENFLLKGQRIRADAHEWLAARLPKKLTAELMVKSRSSSGNRLPTQAMLVQILSKAVGIVDNRTLGS